MTALASIKLLTPAAFLGFTGADFRLLPVARVGLVTDGSRLRRCVVACVYGTLLSPMGRRAAGGGWVPRGGGRRTAFIFRGAPAGRAPADGALVRCDPADVVGVLPRAVGTPVVKREAHLLGVLLIDAEDDRL